MSEKYPTDRRGTHWSHHLVRAMGKTCLAQTIGPEACWLITVIAHTEDAKKYSGAVTYYNEQLMPLCGFRTHSRPIRAREKAVSEGWLHYRPGGKAKAGLYWTLNPKSCEVESAPKIEAQTERKRSANGVQTERKRRHPTLTLAQEDPAGKARKRATSAGGADPAACPAGVPSELAEYERIQIAPLPPNSLASGVWRPIRQDHLRDVRGLVEWHRRQLAAAAPVLPATAAAQVLVIAAAIRAVAMPASEVRRSRVAVFAATIKRQAWFYLVPYLSQALEAWNELDQNTRGVDVAA
jgi:hypothetical protein